MYGMYMIICMYVVTCVFTYICVNVCGDLKLMLEVFINILY